MAAGSALKARAARSASRAGVVAIELLLAAQAPSTSARPWHRATAARRPARPSGGGSRRCDRDRYLKADLDAALELCEGGAVLAAVEAAIGALE